MNHTSSSRPDVSKCRERARLLGAYLDGELEPAQLLDVEGHVAECAACRERVELDRATRASMKRTMKAAAPEGLRARALAAMQAEKARGEARQAAVAEPRAWRTLVPLASAAALALAFGSLGRGTPSGADRPDEAGFVSDALLQELIEEHSHPVPSYDRTDREGARELERYVGVPVRPAAFERGGARFVGGRVMPVQGAQHAAMLQYVIGTGEKAQHVSVFVYDPSKIQVHGADLAPRAVGTAQVRVGTDHGYSVAVTQNAGVGYAVATDMDTERSAQLAALANQD